MTLFVCFPCIHPHMHKQTNKTTKKPKGHKKYRRIQTDMIKQMNIYGLKIQKKKTFSLININLKLKQNLRLKMLKLNT